MEGDKSSLLQYNTQLYYDTIPLDELLILLVNTFEFGTYLF